MIECILSRLLFICNQNPQEYRMGLCESWIRIVQKIWYIFCLFFTNRTWLSSKAIHTDLCMTTRYLRGVSAGLGPSAQPPQMHLEDGQRRWNHEPHTRNRHRLTETSMNETTGLYCTFRAHWDKFELFIFVQLFRPSSSPVFLWLLALWH